MSVNHVAVLTKDRQLSVVPIIVDYYMVPVNRPVKKQGSHRQGLLITHSQEEAAKIAAMTKTQQLKASPNQH